MLKRSHLISPFDGQRVNGSQTLIKSPRKHFYPFHSQHRNELSSNMSPLLRSEILELFVNTLTADDKYFCHYRKKFAQPIQMRLSRKVNVFSLFFIAFLKYTSTLKYFEKED